MSWPARVCGCGPGKNPTFWPRPAPALTDRDGASSASPDSVTTPGKRAMGATPGASLHRRVTLQGPVTNAPPPAQPGADRSWDWRFFCRKASGAALGTTRAEGPCREAVRFGFLPPNLACRDGRRQVATAEVRVKKNATCCVKKNAYHYMLWLDGLCRCGIAPVRLVPRALRRPGSSPVATATGLEPGRRGFHSPWRVQPPERRSVSPPRPRPRWRGSTASTRAGGQHQA